MVLIVEADHIKYLGLLDDMRNNFLMGHNNYPKLITEDYNPILYLQNRGASICNQYQGHIWNIIFNKSKVVGYGKDEKFSLDIQCFKFKYLGHYNNNLS